jgi:hypothetical protein
VLKKNKITNSLWSLIHKPKSISNGGSSINLSRCSSLSLLCRKVHLELNLSWPTLYLILLLYIQQLSKIKIWQIESQLRVNQFKVEYLMAIEELNMKKFKSTITVIRIVMEVNKVIKQFSLRLIRKIN